MTQQEAETRDAILKFLIDNGGKQQFNGCDDISKALNLEKHTVSTYCEEMSFNGHVQFDRNLQGCSVRVLDRGIHYYNSGGYKEQVFTRTQQEINIESDRKEERLTRKVSRRTAIGSLIISIVALILALLAFLSQLFGWYHD